MTASPSATALAFAAFTAGRPGPELPLDAASLLADDAARFSEVNDQAVNLLHYSREELLQMRVWDITPELQRPDALELWKAFIGVGEQSGVYQARRRDGRLITVEYVAVANYRPGAHLSVLRPIGRTMAAGRSLDECPYERPSRLDFAAVPPTSRT
ncbi:MAG: PAS domain-containing protein [Candidatus Dormibacteraeota bacterium]|nr:PAS domain-containing protein [Candidatus Dormibacteraeota bacterium]